MVDVPALNVRLVFTAKESAVPPAAIDTVLLPRLIVLALAEEELKIVVPISVRLLLFVVNVPAWIRKFPPELTVSGSPSVTVIPVPFIVIVPAKVLAALVNVPVPFMVKAPL